MRTLLVFFLIIPLALGSCNKEMDVEPPYQNKFSCKVDGVPFYNDDSLIFEVQGFYSNISSRGSVTGIVKKVIKDDRPKTLTTKTIGLTIHEWKPGKQELKSAKYSIYDDHCGENAINKEEFQNLRITHLDVENKIIKGKFNFSTINNCDKTEKHHIPFGEFDVRYKVVN